MYEGFYKLQARPFQLMPDPRRLFEASSHSRGLSYLIYGLERGEGFVVVTGAVGTGKTLLLQVLLDQIRTRHMTVARVAMANVDADNVLGTVASAFGVTARGQTKYELIDALVAKFSSARNRRAILIVDEAQACSAPALDELRIVSNLQARGTALVQIVLVGQSELRDLLMIPAMSHLRQRIVASYHLEPLAPDEVAGYIEHRLKTVGWRADRLSFGLDVYERVYEWSGGVPRRINQIMDRLLLHGYLEERRELMREDLEIAIREFELEFAGEEPDHDGATPASALIAAPAAAAAPTSDTAATIGPLLERVAAVERALRAAFGEERVAEFMRHHEASNAQRELVAAVMRVERLESVLRDLQPSDPTPNTDQHSAEASVTDEPVQATEPSRAHESWRRMFTRE